MFAEHGHNALFSSSLCSEMRDHKIELHKSSQARGALSLPKESWGVVGSPVLRLALQNKFSDGFFFMHTVPAL